MHSTVLVLRMAHRILKETKQHPGTDGLGNILGCCLVSLRFLRYIHSIHSVVDAFSKDAGQISK